METKGNCNIKGKSGEISCSQYMPKTWQLYSKQVLGYVAPVNYTNDVYISSKKIQTWLNRGYNIKTVLLFWNAGENAKKCNRGTNSKGVKYNSCEYVKRGIKIFNLH